MRWGKPVGAVEVSDVAAGNMPMTMKESARRMLLSGNEAIARVQKITLPKSFGRTGQTLPPSLFPRRRILWKASRHSHGL